MPTQAKKATAKKATAKKATAKKVTAKKATAKKVTAKKVKAEDNAPRTVEEALELNPGCVVVDMPANYEWFHNNRRPKDILAGADMPADRRRVADMAAVRAYYMLRKNDLLERTRVGGQIRFNAHGKAYSEEKDAKMGPVMLSMEDRKPLEEEWEAANTRAEASAERLKLLIKRFSITDWLMGIKGIKEVTVAGIVGMIDIHRADTVSALWQLSGMNPGMVRGKKRIQLANGGYCIVKTETMIKGDRYTKGFLAPFIKELRILMCGIVGPCMIKGRNSEYKAIYDDYKNRLANSDVVTNERKCVEVDGRIEWITTRVKWKDAAKGHRHNAANRYMVKMFLKNLYPVWRELEGLPVREPYQEAKLGHVHGGGGSVRRKAAYAEFPHMDEDEAFVLA